MSKMSFIPAEVVSGVSHSLTCFYMNQWLESRIKLCSFFSARYLKVEVVSFWNALTYVTDPSDNWVKSDRTRCDVKTGGYALIFNSCTKVPFMMSFC